MRADLALIGFILTLAGGAGAAAACRCCWAGSFCCWPQPRLRCIWQRRFCWCWQSGSSVCEKRRKMT